MAGGQLEQLSTHATSSSLSIEIPVKTDDIKECDYVELYDSEQIILPESSWRKSKRHST